MDGQVIFSIALEIWGIVICAFAFLALLLEKSQRKGKKGVSLCMEALCILLLVADSLAWYYRGRTGETAYYMVRICNFCVFLFNYVYMGMFTLYLLIVLHAEEKKMPVRARIVLVLAGLGMVMLVVSQFSDNLYYYIDSNNVYHRSNGYLFSQLIAAAGLVLLFSILVQYRKRMEKAVFLATLTYFALPCISTIIVMFYYGMSLQIISIVMSTQIMFVVDMVEVDRTLLRSKLAFEHARYEADHDQLTGLYNKSAGLDKIKNYISSMSETDKASLVFIDIDDFKSVNDTYGHAVGDYWIEMVGKLLKSESGAGDIACRFGGDEFVVLHKGVGDAAAMKPKLQRFAMKLQLKAMERGQEVHCSSGICQISGAGHDADECMHIADNALYKAKKNGKHTSVIHSVDQSGTENIEILAQIDSDAAEMQDKVGARISHMYTMMLYVNLRTSDFRVIKGDEALHDAVENAENYEAVAECVVNRLRSERSRSIIGEFIEKARMESQTEDVKSISYANNEDNASLMHVMKTTDSDGGYFIVVQSLNVYVS